MKWWRDHSLTIVLWAIGLALVAASYPFQSGWWCDALMSAGSGTLTAGLVFALSGKLNEKNKPEKIG